MPTLNATSCTGWECSIEGQLCPKGVPGASAGNYLCKDNKWVIVDPNSTWNRDCPLYSQAQVLDRGHPRRCCPAAFGALEYDPVPLA